MIARMTSFGVTPAGSVAVDVDRHPPRPRLGQRLRGQHVLDLARADAEREGAERAVGRRVAVAAHDRHARQRAALLGPDDVDDALAGVAHRVVGDAELGGVAAQRLDLLGRDLVGDRLVDVGRRDVVVLGGDGQLGPADAPPGQAQPLERLRAGDLVDEVEVDVEQVGLVRRRAARTTWRSQILAGSVAAVIGGRSLLVISNAEIAFLTHGQRIERRRARQGDRRAPRDRATTGRSRSSICRRRRAARATLHRLAVALERHGLLRRDQAGRFCLGLGLVALGNVASETFPIAALARPRLAELCQQTGESVQLYVRDGERRRCAVSFPSPHGLRWMVGEGALLPLHLGSAGRVLTGEVGRARLGRDGRGARARRGVGERADRRRRRPACSPPSASAARSSGSTRQPGKRFGADVVAAAADIAATL